VIVPNAEVLHGDVMDGDSLVMLLNIDTLILILTIFSNAIQGTWMALDHVFEQT